MKTLLLTFLAISTFLLGKDFDLHDVDKYTIGFVLEYDEKNFLKSIDVIYCLDPEMIGFFLGKIYHQKPRSLGNRNKVVQFMTMTNMGESKTARL